MTLGVRNRLPLLPINVAIIAIVLFTYTDEVKSAGPQYVGKFLGKLSEFHHGVSGEVYVVDGRTLHIKDFTYDGQGPAAYFYAGNSKEPSNLGGFRVPDERGSTDVLKRYRKRSITLTLPDGKTLNNIKWFSVWCDEFSVNFGDVRIPRSFDYPKPQKIDPLNGVHSISSDNIVIVDAQTLLIPNLSFDGEAPDAKFWVGRGPKPSPQGIRVPDENGKEIPLRRYDRKTVVLTLPQDLTVFDIGHFGIWCEAFTVDFGHVQIPPNLNVPPSLKMLGISPQSKLNCEVLNDDLAFEVRWAVAGDSIVVQLVSKLDDGEYMSFGVSGDDKKSVMVGGDVVVAWVDKTSLKGYAIDYYLDAKAQCAGKRGSCPDENIMENTNSVRLLNAAMVNGYSIVTYQRTLKAADVLDRQILINKPQAIIWAIGPLNQRNEVSFHNHYLKTDYLLDFGRQPKWNCPMPETDRPASISNPIPIDSSPAIPSRSGGRFEDFIDTEEKVAVTPRRGSSNRGNTRSSERRQRTTTSAPRTVPTPKAVADRDAWDIPAIQCYEPEDGVFYAQMGPTGGKKGYSAITGHVGWGISWYINGLLIPEINVVRGKTYTFVVEGGLNPEVPARYHPFYITDDSVGGYEHKTPEEKSKVRIFAGATSTRAGDLLPTGTGRLCHWTPKGDAYPEDFASFGGYQRTLELVCDDGEPGVVTWTPDKNTPDTVYYQCWSHRYLGWKINVLDSCDITAAGSELVPSVENPPQSFKASQTGDFSDDFEASPSILLERRVKPNDISFSTQNKDIYNMNPVYTHDQNVPTNQPTAANTDVLFRHSAELSFIPSQLDVARDLTRPPTSTPEAYDVNKDNDSSRSNIKLLDPSEQPEIITLEQFTTLPSPTPSSEDASPESFVFPSTTISSASTVATVEKNTFLHDDGKRVATEPINMPDKETQPPLSLLRYASISNFPQGLNNNQISFRRPSNDMNFNIRPLLMHKHPHVFTTRYGITNRPFPIRPPFINPSMFVKKPYYRPTMNKRPIPMATILRPVTQFPPKHSSGKPIFMKPTPAISFKTNNGPIYMKPQSQMTRLNWNIPPRKFINNPQTNNKSNFTHSATETFKNIPILHMFQNSKFASLNNDQSNSFPVIDDSVTSSDTLNRFIFPSTTSKLMSTFLISDKNTLNTKTQDFNSIPPDTKTNTIIFQTQKSTTTEVSSNEQKKTDDDTVTEDPILSPSKMISIQPDFRKTYSTMRPAINTGFHPESVIIEGGFKPIISKPVPVAQDRISEVDDMESISDTIGIIDYTKTDRTHENKKAFPLQPIETFEPMFIPSPPDRRSVRNKTSSDSKTAQKTLDTHINLKRTPVRSTSNKPFVSREENASFADNGRSTAIENQDEDEIMMAAERIDTYYLPPTSKSRSRTVQHPADIKIPSGTIVTYDGKIVSSINLSPPVVTRTNFAKSGLSNTEQLVRATPQFGSFKGELPPPIPANIQPETIPQLRNSKQNIKFANGPQFDPNRTPPESTKLSLIQLRQNDNLKNRDTLAAEITQRLYKSEKSRKKRAPHHTPEHTAQQQNTTETNSKSTSVKWNASLILPLSFSIITLIVSKL